MNIQLMYNLSDNNTINKSLTTLNTMTAEIKQESSVIDPELLVTAYPLNANYLYIPQFKRYYFITNVTSVRNGLWRITCHVDVLETYKEAILKQYAIIKRQEFNYNLLQDDSEFKVYKDRLYQTLTVGAASPVLGTDYYYILTLGGGN